MEQRVFESEIIPCQGVSNPMVAVTTPVGKRVMETMGAADELTAFVAATMGKPEQSPSGCCTNMCCALSGCEEDGICKRVNNVLGGCVADGPDDERIEGVLSRRM